MSIRMISPEISSFGRKWSPWPTSEPTSSTTSASARACWLAFCKIEQPRDKGWDSGRIPLPALVERTGAPIRSAIAVSALRVPTAPPPTRIRGRFACARRSAASSIAAGSGIGKDGARRRLPVVLDGFREDVPRQRQMNRTRPAAAKHRIGTSNQFWQLFRISDHGAERGEPGRDRGLVGELVDRSPAFPLRERGARSG